MSDPGIFASKPVRWVAAGLAGLLSTSVAMMLATVVISRWIIGDNPSSLDRAIGVYLMVFVGIVGVLSAGLIVVVVVRKTHDVEVGSPQRLRRPQADSPAASAWTFTWAALVLLVTLVAVPGAMVVAVRWLKHSDFLQPEILVPIALIIGLVGLITALSAMVAVFVRAGVVNKDEALGFPSGSVRALIALLLILMFAILAVFFYSQVRGGEVLESVSRAEYEGLLAQDRVVGAKLVNDNVNDALDKFDVRVASDQQSTDIAKQLLTTLSTLVVALAAFYFGNKAITTAADVVGSDGEPSLDLTPNPADGAVSSPVGGPVEVRVKPGDGVTARVTDVRNPQAGRLGTVRSEGDGRFTYQPERAGRFVIAFTRRGITSRLTVAAGVDVIEPTESPARTGVDEPLKIKADPVAGLKALPPKDSDGKPTMLATISDDGGGEFTFAATAPGSYSVDLKAPGLTTATVEIEVEGVALAVKDAADVSETPEGAKVLDVPINETVAIAVAPVPGVVATAVDASGKKTDAVLLAPFPGEDGKFTVLVKQAGAFRIDFTAPDRPPTSVELDVSPRAGGFEGGYTVRAGDSLGRIAATYDTTVDLLMGNNPTITDPNLIEVGWQLNVPLMGTSESIQPVVAPDVAELGGQPPWLLIAEKELESEIHEKAGAANERRIIEYHATTTLRATTDATPWCSSFVNWCIEQANLTGTKSARALSWLEWKEGERLAKPIPGCIVVFTRGKPGQGHVAFFVESSGDNLIVLGGNQSDRVSRKAYSKDRLKGYFWPTAYPQDVMRVEEATDDDSSRKDWSKVSEVDRLGMAMDLLVNSYGYSEEAAAGIVGNLYVESGVIPNRLEGSTAKAPMTSKSFDGKPRTWTPEQIMTRDKAAKRGPLLAGVGLAQWTWHTRRDGLFAHEFEGKTRGGEILYMMDGQIDYLVHELKRSYKSVDATLHSAGVTIEKASDVFLLEFEKPAVQDEAQKAKRRTHAKKALEAYRASKSGN